MSAVFSPCGLFRLRLDRDVQEQGIVAALFGVNPSYAGVTKNDPTIRKDLGFARVNGWRKIIKANAFSFCSTDVKGLARADNPWGSDNARYVDEVIAEADLLVPCWGSRTKLPRHLRPTLDRLGATLRSAGKPVLIFGLTESGDPMHPLMLPYSTKLVPWGAA